MVMQAAHALMIGNIHLQFCGIKGLPGPLKGGVILECLTSRFNFT
jgi:hypothetical protein